MFFRKFHKLRSEYSKRKGFRVYGIGEEGPIKANVNSGDLLVQKENEIVAPVECKGTYSLLEQDLGQCSCYYTSIGDKKTHGKVKVYLAVPSDYG